MLGNTRLLFTGALAMVLLLLLAAIPGGYGVCCSSYIKVENDIISSLCGDCTRPTPYCGYGPCNIFGCNCDGGCRTGPCEFSGRRRDVFAAADKDGDLKVSLAEALDVLKDTSLPPGKAKSFRKMDRDNDGFLTRDEMD